LFLILKKKGQAQQEQRSDEDHANHREDSPLALAERGRPEGRRLDTRFVRVRASRAADSGPVAMSLILLL
jgi:hypothetical protein